MIVVEKLISQLPAENAMFFCTMHKHFARSTALQVFHLVNLKLGREAWSNISRGIGKSKSLRALRFNKCNLSQIALELLLGGLGKNESLESLDLSHNDMEDSTCGTAVVKLLQAQSEHRDNIVWSLGLRGETPSLEETGLCEVKLSFNRFGSDFSKSLSQFIKYDRYVRVIDVSHNQIENLKELAGAIKSSDALVAFDARFNQGYNAKVHKLIALKLLRNIDRLAGAKVPLKRAWIRREILEVNYDDPAATFEE